MTDSPILSELARACRWTGPGITFRTVRSPRGFAFDELKSAMQKYIRRAEAQKAAGCAAEIHAISASQLVSTTNVRTSGAKRVFTNLIHRLIIIYMEDCGPPAAKYYDQVSAILEQLGSGRAPLTDAIFAREHQLVCELAAILAIMPHSRIFSHIRAVQNATPEQMRTAIEPIVRLKSNIARGYSHDATVADAKHAIAHADAVADVIESLFVLTLEKPAWKVFEDCWARELRGCRESFLSRMMHNARKISARREPFAPTTVDLPPLDAATIAQSLPIPLDDYAIDMHTSRGRARGLRGTAGKAQFAASGAIVANEDAFWRCPTLEEFYLMSKSDPAAPIAPPFAPSATPTIATSVRENIPACVRESCLFEFDVRAQLTTGPGKTDTYFARILTDEQIRARAPPEEQASYMQRCAELRAITSPEARVFVKGPLPHETVQLALSIANIKRTIFLELPSVRICAISCTNFDLLASPLGIRVGKSLSPQPIGAFWLLVARDVAFLPGAPIPRIPRESKMWTSTMVADWRGIALDNEELTRAIGAHDVVFINDIKANYIFRFILAIGDGALRNLMHYALTAGRIIATDEDALHDHWTWTQFVATLGSNALKDLMKNPFVDGFDRVMVQEWRARLEVRAARPCRLDLHAAIARIDDLLRACP